MASLWGIETEDDCRKKIDELLELHSVAEREMTKEALAILKSRLKEYYKQVDSRRMSRVEGQWFWPAIQSACVKGPNLGSRRTWPVGLYQIEAELRYHRPTEPSGTPSNPRASHRKVLTTPTRNADKEAG